MAEPVGIVREFERGLFEELNFRIEAANIREFGALHANRPDIAIPTVYGELCTTAVLTLEYLDGIPFSRLPTDVDRKAIAERIVREAFEEVFVDGVFHADPHPGNLMYMGPGRYGLLDFGLLGRLSANAQETLIVFALAVALRDADSVARTLYRLGHADRRIDIAAMRRDTADLFDRYLNRRLQDVDSNLLMQELLQLALKHGIRVPAEYTMLGRASATIEGIVRESRPRPRRRGDRAAARRAHPRSNGSPRAQCRATSTRRFCSFRACRTRSRFSSRRSSPTWPRDGSGSPSEGPSWRA
jgi:ubiquinone biosynthesis protein